MDRGRRQPQIGVGVARRLGKAPGGAMRLLLLGGTQEAHHIAAALRREVGLSLTVSLAKQERHPKPFAWPVRIGGFGGEEGYVRWLTNAGVTGVLDASHPFSTGMGHRTRAIADRLGLDYVRFLRPNWLPGQDDRWTFLNTASEAAAQIPEGATVFLATGRRELDQFSN